MKMYFITAIVLFCFIRKNNTLIQNLIYDGKYNLDVKKDKVECLEIRKKMQKVYLYYLLHRSVPCVTKKYFTYSSNDCTIVRP